MFLQKNQKNIFMIAGLFLSGLVGAGFGSGREIFVYFASLGPVGAIGFILSCALLGWASVRILIIVQGGHFTHAGQVARFVAKGRIGGLFTLSMLLFSLIGYVAMLSGIRTVLQPVFPAVQQRFPFLFGLCICGLVAAFSLLVFNGNFPVFARVCTVVTMGIVFCVAAVAITAAFTAADRRLPSGTYPKMATLILKSGLYTGYNLLFLLGVLGRTGHLEADARAVRRGSLLGTCVFLVAGLCIFAALSVVPARIAGSDMPLPAVIGGLGTWEGRIFACVLAVAMMLCAACSLGAVGSVFGKKMLAATTFAAIGIPLSYVGFDRVVSVIYPIFGFVGILFLLALAQTRRKIV